MKVLSLLAGYSTIFMTTCVIILIAPAWSPGPAWSQDQVAVGVSPADDQKMCVSLNLIQATEILNDQEIILTLRDGEILALLLPDSCPQLKYHGSFTYRATGGRLCEGEDKIVTRSGDACTIGAFAFIDSRQAPE